MASLRWNFGVHNFMTYLTGNLTTGVYHSQSIANVGIGHNAIDGGGAYTYFDPKAGHEFSATLGFTYNSKIRIRITRTASTCIWIGVRRNS